MSFKKRKNKRFDKPKQPIRKDKLQMHIDSIGECIKQAQDYLDNKMTGCSKEEAEKAEDTLDDLHHELDILIGDIGDLVDGFYL